MDLWVIPFSVVCGLLVVWLMLIAAMWVARPNEFSVREILRLLPDLLRLLRRLGADGSLPRGVRVRVWLLLAYLAMPIDVVPDFIPVLGYADDVIVAAMVLRSVVRIAGPEAIDEHWPGTSDGLVAVRKLAGMP